MLVLYVWLFTRVLGEKTCDLLLVQNHLILVTSCLPTESPLQCQDFPILKFGPLHNVVSLWHEWMLSHGSVKFVSVSRYYCGGCKGAGRGGDRNIKTVASIPCLSHQLFPVLGFLPWKEGSNAPELFFQFTCLSQDPKEPGWAWNPMRPEFQVGLGYIASNKQQ